MKNLNRNLKKVYQIFNCAIIAVATVLLCISAFTANSDISQVKIVLLAIVFQTAILASANKNFRIAIWAGILSIFIAVWLFLQLTHQDMQSYYNFLALSAFVFTACLACSALSKKIWLQAVAVLAVVSAIIVLSILEISVSKLCVVLVVLSVALFLAQLNEKTDKAQNTNFLFLTPVFVLVCIPFFLLPVKETPIKWTTVKSVISAIDLGIQNIWLSIEYLFDGSEIFTISNAGFGDTVNLGGMIEVSNDKTVLTVSGNKTNLSLYLAGASYNQYNGTKWENTAKEFKNIKNTEQEFLTNALLDSGLTSKEYASLKKSAAYYISYSSIKTKSLFLPEYVLRINLDEKTKTNYKNDQIVLSKPKGAGFGYEVVFVEYNWSSDKLQSILRQNELYPVSQENKEFVYFQDYVYSNYTKLPNDIPKRVYDLAYKITEGKNNDYDKVIAIRDYLINNYTYDTKPSEVPKDADFVDYFLFEDKKGYCTYFATGMAVLSRCVGVPTRYVEGVITRDTTKYAYVQLPVTNDKCHAWAQVYIKNIGWITLDATPGYSREYPKNWASGVVEGNKISDEGKPDIGVVSDEEDALLIDAKSETFAEKAIFVLKIVLIFVAALVLVMCSLLLVKFIRKQMYRKKTPYQRLQYIVTHSFYLGKLYGVVRDNAQTLENYNLRLQQQLDTENLKYSDICEMYQAARFGGKEVSQAKLIQAEQWQTEIEKGYLKNCKLIDKILFCLKCFE